MKKIFKPARALFVTSVLGATLSGCGIGGIGVAGPQYNNDGAIVLDFWHGQGGDAGTMLEENVDDFNEEHRGEIYVNAIYQGGYEENFTKLAANIQTGNVPVLMQANDIQTSYMKDSGITLPMQEALGDDADEVIDNLQPTVANYYVLDGELWSMPLFTSLPVAYINTDILVEAGIDRSELVTFDDYFDAADTIYEETGIPGLVFATNAWFNEEFTAGLNQIYCAPDNGVRGERADSMAFLTEDFVRLWERIQEGYERGSIVNVGPDGNAGANLLTSGNVGMQFNSSANVTSVQDSGINFAVQQLPIASEEAGQVPGGNSLWVLDENKTQEEVDAAVEFARYVHSDTWQSEVLDRSGGVPNTISGAENSTHNAPQQQALIDILEDIPPTVETAGCHMGALSQVRVEVENAVQAVADGDDVREAFEEMEGKIDLHIERYENRAEATAEE
ncbi:extracellular solute-binding protein [Auritidibacter ignavus]|uniref:extracellular solute-binding protein n=1 Tax=Auritidibacter ignavus TaxID=678932 RepID=UPI00109D3F0E|nr:extracellular solute-binding protein [Auritidibacter ignavus]